LYRRALSVSELDSIRLRNASIPAGQVLRLPFDRLHG
jgi:sialidase-1